MSTKVEYPIHELIEKRRSRRALDARPIEDSKIKSLFEAARWAPSSVNEQPWEYVVALKGEPLWDEIFQTLNQSNQEWVKEAPVLIASFFRKILSRNNAANGAAHYDTGAANALLSIQATALGLNVHQIGGYNREAIRQALNVPSHLDPAVVMAVGYPGDPASLSERNRDRELAPRERRGQESFVRNSKW